MEIKFRAWDKNKSSFYKVDTISFNEQGEVEAIWTDGPDFARVKPGNRHGINSEYNNLDDVVLLQYTGINDTGGNEIYEGHILKGRAIRDEGEFNYLGKMVFYNQSNVHGYHLEDKNGGAWRLEQLHSKISLDNATGEIIGNIYENPELLEG